MKHTLALLITSTALTFLSSQYEPDYETLDRGLFTAYRLMLGSFEPSTYADSGWMRTWICVAASRLLLSL